MMARLPGTDVYTWADLGTILNPEIIYHLNAQRMENVPFAFNYITIGEASKKLYKQSGSGLQILLKPISRGFKTQV